MSFALESGDKEVKAKKLKKIIYFTVIHHPQSACQSSSQE